MRLPETTGSAGLLQLSSVQSLSGGESLRERAHLCWLDDIRYLAQGMGQRSVAMQRFPINGCQAKELAASKTLASTCDDLLSTD